VIAVVVLVFLPQKLFFFTKAGRRRLLRRLSWIMLWMRVGRSGGDVFWRELLRLESAGLKKSETTSPG